MIWKNGLMAALALLLCAGTGVAQELSAADAKAFPFPPGPGAALTKQTCTRCHDANLIVARTWTEDMAVRYYKLMTGGDPGTPDAQTVIAYLANTLGEDRQDR
jgi:hypothetical protein